MKTFFNKTAALRVRIALSSFVILVLITIAATYIFSVHFQEGDTISVSGRHNLNFRVFYIGNDTFPQNPIPANFDFLMSYTDYIEVDSSLSVSFNREMDVSFTYQAQKRFIIRHIGCPDHRFVFEEIIILSDITSRTTTNALALDSIRGGIPGGTYTIYPRQFISQYRAFLAEQTQQMADENAIAIGFRGFTAEIVISFTYAINAPEFGLSETITHGYKIPLTAEIYSFETIGTSNFEWVANIEAPVGEITLPIAILYVLTFTMSVLLLLRDIHKSSTGTNSRQAQANHIIKKYANEIVIYNKPVDKNMYEPRDVAEFSELLKLAITLNKHVMCYKNSSYTEFAVMVDEFACMYVVHHEEES